MDYLVADIEHKVRKQLYELEKKKPQQLNDEAIRFKALSIAAHATEDIYLKIIQEG
jgi:hypothetical protein